MFQKTDWKVKFMFNGSLVIHVSEEEAETEEEARQKAEKIFGENITNEKILSKLKMTIGKPFRNISKKIEPVESKEEVA